MNSKKRKTRSTSTVDETRACPRVESTGASILLGASSTSVLGGEIINSQRDHNRATFIINLGGYDSDTSRSTLAVSNPTTSGSVGDSPHDSTESSSVRDLPYSSTSPASNQEQSSPEEFSVSTDSGLGGSEVSPEIESPPTEEGDLVEKESSNSIYKRHMYLEAHGFPLWIPQPNMTLRRSYQRQGVSIGDVGIFTSDGGFDFLFNVCLPAGHASNPDELPEGFSRLELKPEDVCKFRAHSSHSHLVSPSVKKRDRATFECSSSDGAILAMPQGAYHEDLKNIRRFRKYTLIHAESWYQYANGPCGREIGNGELHLVTGCDKATSWGIATYSHLQSELPEDTVSLLRFNPVGSEHQGRYASHTMYEWDYEGVAEGKFGPEEDELMDLGVEGSVPPRNQCTFIRSLTPAFGKDDWEHLELKVESSVKDQATVRSPKSHFPSVFGAISSLSGRIGLLRGHSREGSSEMIDSMTPAQTTAIHPATYVIDMMLQKCPKAKVVVVHDSDWCSVIRDSDEDWTYTAQDLPRRIQEAFHIVEEKNGTVYLEEKTRSSQDLSTSSYVSEVEDRPLLENRKFWPSQLFDPFGTPPSDMEVDFPRSFKKTLDGDEDIKSNTCHGSGEDDDNDLGDEDLPLLDDRKLRSSQIFDSFEISSSNMKVDSPRFFKKSVDDWGDDNKSSEKCPSGASIWMASLNESDDNSRFYDDKDELPNLQPDVVLLEFIFHKVQEAKNKDSFKEYFSAPRSPKTSGDDHNDDSNLDSSEGHLGLEMVHKESSWTDNFLEYISLQIQKLRNNPPYDNQFSVNHGSSQGPFKLDMNDLDHTHHVMLNRIIKDMFRQLDSLEELADDDDDDAKSDLFEDPTQANSKYSEGKFVRWGGEFHIEVPSDDEVYSMSNVVPSSDPGFKTHLPNNRSASSPVLLTPKSPIDSGENETPVEEPSWWWSGSTARTPTATTFMQVDSSTAGVSPDGFISLMDSQSLPFGPSPPINSEGKRAQKVPDEDDDPGLGNPKRATGYNDGSTPASASPKVEEQTQNADKGGVMPYNDFSSSSGSSTYHIPLEEELSGRGRLSLSVANRLNHHAPEPSTQTHETNIPFPSFPRDDRNPLSLEDSLEPRGAAGDRDDIVSDSTFGTEYGASIPYLFSDRDLDILAEKVLPLAHSRSAGGIHHRVVASSKQPAVSEKRRTRPALFTCSLCSNAFTTNHNLKHHLNSHFGNKTHSCPDCKAVFSTRSSLNRHRKKCNGPKTKALLEHTQQSNQLGDNSIIETERPM